MLKAAYAHNIDAYQSVGAEVSKAAREEAADVHVMLGYSKRLTDGALLKAKVQNSGLVTLLYESVSTTCLSSCRHSDWVICFPRHCSCYCCLLCGQHGWHISLQMYM